LANKLTQLQLGGAKEQKGKNLSTSGDSQTTTDSTECDSNASAYCNSNSRINIYIPSSRTNGWPLDSHINTSHPVHVAPPTGNYFPDPGRGRPMQKRQPNLLWRAEKLSRDVQKHAVQSSARKPPI